MGASRATPATGASTSSGVDDGDRTGVLDHEPLGVAGRDQGLVGEDVEQAVFYPEHDRFLVERELFVTHYEIAGP